MRSPGQTCRTFTQPRSSGARVFTKHAGPSTPIKGPSRRHVREASLAPFGICVRVSATSARCAGDKTHPEGAQATPATRERGQPYRQRLHTRLLLTPFPNTTSAKAAPRLQQDKAASTRQRRATPPDAMLVAPLRDLSLRAARSTDAPPSPHACARSSATREPRSEKEKVYNERET